MEYRCPKTLYCLGCSIGIKHLLCSVPSALTGVKLLAKSIISVIG